MNDLAVSLTNLQPMCMYMYIHVYSPSKKKKGEGEGNRQCKIDMQIKQVIVLSEEILNIPNWFTHWIESLHGQQGAPKTLLVTWCFTSAICTN